MSRSEPSRQEERRSFSVILQEVVSYARSYLDGLAESEDSSTPGFYQTCRVEEQIARSAFRLLQCFDELERNNGTESPPALPLRVERSLRAIHDIVSRQVDRWGWSDLKRADGETCIEQRLQNHHTHKELPYLRAVLTWRQGDHVETHIKADDEADRARGLGIEPDPDLSPDHAKLQALQRHESWWRDAAFGDSPPQATPEERNDLAAHLDTVVTFFRGLVNSPAAGRERESNVAPASSGATEGSQAPKAPDGSQAAPFKGKKRLEEEPAPQRLSAENRALAVALRHVKEGKPLVITRIAEEAGCSARYLHKCPGFKGFVAAYERDKSHLPRGRKDRESGDVEAWRDGE